MGKNKISVGRLIITLIMLMIVIVGGTFAWFTYQSNKSALVLNIGDINDSKVIIKPYQIRETLTPVNVYTSGVYSQVDVVNENSGKMLMTLFYKVNELSSELANAGLKYTIVSSASKNGTYTEVLTGDFTTLGSDNEIEILDVRINGSTNIYYRVYLWLDSNAGNQSAIQNSVLDVELNARISRDANAPVLDEGMIPVTISNDGTVTTILSSDEDWYNYADQEWANIVLVSESSRNTYLNTENVTVNSSDILAYYVWIPRYKYKIWTTGVSSTGKEQSIDIVFETNGNPAVLGNGVNEYRTHPAFWWDADSDGTMTDSELLPGIWVGKFEMTGDDTTPTVLPNTTSLRNQYVSTQFTTSLKFAGGTLNSSSGSVSFSGNSTYGLTTSTDSHMMKNSEWGAVAYLSHSSYGINQEIRINNNSNYTTGCGASTADEAESTTCGITYGQASSYPQSTTGNITGVYDMSGGAWEYVMGNYANTVSDSGFTTFPDSKYYDLYSSSQFTGDYITNMSFCTLDTCGGHALNETSGWYSDTAHFVNSDRPWFLRGGIYFDGVFAGAFSSSYNIGDWYHYNSFRSVLVPYEQEIQIVSTISSYSCANGNVGSEPYTFTYTGDCTVEGVGTEDWKVKFLTSGDFTPSNNMEIDVFLVGGGGAGGTGFNEYVKDDDKFYGSGGGGGAGGYAITHKNVSVSSSSYTISIGSGGTSSSRDGGVTSAFGLYALGGGGGTDATAIQENGEPGLGGNNGGSGSVRSSEGSTPGSDGENGQRITTKEFGESTGTEYAGGGAGGRGRGSSSSSSSVSGGAGGGGASGVAGTANTGGGGGGGNGHSSSESTAGGDGGSGVVVIRNAAETYSTNTVPEITYTGMYLIVNDNDEIIGGSTGNWKIMFLSSGTLTTTASMEIDAFLVGGGGAGGDGLNEYDKDSDTFNGSAGGGGAGGYTVTHKNVTVNNASYTITVGSGGTSSSRDGGTTSAFGLYALGGGGGTDATSDSDNGEAGIGGNNGGSGAYRSRTGSTPGSDGENGQGRTTGEFGSSSATLYAGGGAGGMGQRDSSDSSSVAGGTGGGGASGTPAYYSNSGSGGGGGNGFNGGSKLGQAGADGIVVIRNARTSVNLSTNKIPKFTYTGMYLIVNDSDEIIGGSTGNWKIKFLSSGTLKFTSLGSASSGIDLFLLGGGGGGGNGLSSYDNDYSIFKGYGGGGGGGGYSNTSTGVSVALNTNYTITVGSGGARSGGTGGSSSAFTFSASGGGGGSSSDGSGYASGGTGSASGGTGAYRHNEGSTPDDGTVYEFGSSSATQYAGGGAGGMGINDSSESSSIAGGAGGGGASGAPAYYSNSGSGGGGGNGFSGGSKLGQAGASGIIVIRNTR